MNIKMQLSFIVVHCAFKFAIQSGIEYFTGNAKDSKSELKVALFQVVKSDTIATHSEQKAKWLGNVQYLAKPFNRQLFHSYSLPTYLVSYLIQMMPNIIHVCSLTVSKIYCYKNMLNSVFRCCCISFFLFQISILTFPSI